MSETAIIPFPAHRQVMEFTEVMEANNVNMAAFSAMMGYIASLERRLDTVSNELAAARLELNDIKDKQNHPMRTALENTTAALEDRVVSLRERLETVKQNVIDGCKNALTAFRETGASVLNNVMNFFHVRDSLDGIRKDMDAAVQSAERTMARFDTISTEYHEVGKHLRNVGRALIGRETLDDAKPAGRIVNAVKAPQRIKRAVASTASRGVGAAVANLDKLNESQSDKKPSILKTVDDIKRHTPKHYAPKQPTQRGEASL